MSAGAAALLKESMDYGRPLTPEQIEEERKNLIDLVTKLDKEGKITVRKKVKGGILDGEEAADDTRFSNLVARMTGVGVEILVEPWELGPRKAKEFLWCAETLTAADAERFGLVNKVVTAEAVEAAGVEAARVLASKPPEAVRMARRLMRGERRDIMQRIDQEANSFTDLLRSPAARDALQAYIDAHR